MNRGDAFLQLVLSRLREFYREPIAIFWVYGFPLILAFTLGLAFSSGEVPRPRIDIAGEPGKRPSILPPLLGDTLGYDATVTTVDEGRKRLARGKSALLIVEGDGSLEYVFDPTRPESVHAKNWVDRDIARSPFVNSWIIKESREAAPGSRYIDFLLPGLVGINIMGGGLFGIGFVLVDMRVRKLFKRLMATPMRRGDFLLAVVASRLLFLVPEMASLLVVARWLFGVPINGSWFALAVVVVAGALAFAGIGLLLACRADKIEIISGLVNLVMLPMYLVSGVFFSARNFPDAVQPIIQALPLTRLNDAIREVMLEGAGLVDVAPHLLVLAAWGGISFVLALKWFRWT